MRMHAIVEPWLYWASLTIARRTTRDLAEAHHVAQLALIKMWRKS